MDVRKHLADHETKNGRGCGRGRGRGHGHSVRQHRGGRSKRDVLKMQLESLDIEMDLLPAGMQKRSSNQSTWDHKYASFVHETPISFADARVVY